MALDMICVDENCSKLFEPFCVNCFSEDYHNHKIEVYSLDKYIKSLLEVINKA